MCDIRLFRSARLDYETAKKLWETPWEDEMILNNAAYHLQQAVEKILKAALECGRHCAEHPQDHQVVIHDYGQRRGPRHHRLD